MSDEAFKLTAAERHSALWKKISDHLNERLDTHRKNNDGSNLTHEQTSKLRGRIAEVKYLLGIGEPEEPAIVPDNGDDF